MELQSQKYKKELAMKASLARVEAYLASLSIVLLKARKYSRMQSNLMTSSLKFQISMTLWPRFRTAYKKYI